MPRVKLDSDLHHDIIKDIETVEGFKVSLQTIKAVIRSLKKCMIERVKKTSYCYLANFFGISIVERKPRMTRNPKTGEKIQLPARKKLKLRLAKEFRKINL
jgi:nucleoid DNA-binding protein